MRRTGLCLTQRTSTPIGPCRFCEISTMHGFYLGEMMGKMGFDAAWDNDCGLQLIPTNSISGRSTSQKAADSSRMSSQLPSSFASVKIVFGWV